MDILTLSLFCLGVLRRLISILFAVYLYLLPLYRLVYRKKPAVSEEEK